MVFYSVSTHATLFCATELSRSLSLFHYLEKRQGEREGIIIRGKEEETEKGEKEAEGRTRKKKKNRRHREKEEEALA